MTNIYNCKLFIQTECMHRRLHHQRFDLATCIKRNPTSNSPHFQKGRCHDVNGLEVHTCEQTNVYLKQNIKWVVSSNILVKQRIRHKLLLLEIPCIRIKPINSEDKAIKNHNVDLNF